MIRKRRTNRRNCGLHDISYLCWGETSSRDPVEGSQGSLAASEFIDNTPFAEFAKYHSSCHAQA